MSKRFAVIKDNKVINVIFSDVTEEIASNPEKYIEVIEDWDYNNGIDGGDFFPPLGEFIPPVSE